VGIQGGGCDRDYFARAAKSFGMALRPGIRLGGISINRIVKSDEKLDAADQACAVEALEHSPDGRAVSWRAADGATVTLKPTRSYTGRQGDPCRDFETTIERAGAPRTLTAAACRVRETGSWMAAAR
jgi:surface antigen